MGFNDKLQAKETRFDFTLDLNDGEYFHVHYTISYIKEKVEMRSALGIYWHC